MKTDFTIDYYRLRQRCTMSFEDFSADGVLWSDHFDANRKPTPTANKFYFKDNGARVLAVAHLDTVSNAKHFVVADMDGGERILTRAADDRLGAYLILDLLPQILGDMPYDVLLTDGEESHRSSARIFNCKKAGDYDWIFECDRSGKDVVGYQYYNSEEWLDAVRASGFLSGSYGAYSDIADLDDLGVLGFNFGVGYYENHSQWSHIVTSDLIWCTERIARFIDTNRGVHMPYDPKKSSTRVYGANYGRYGANNRGGYYDHDTGHWVEYGSANRPNQSAAKNGTGGSDHQTGTGAGVNNSTREIVPGKVKDDTFPLPKPRLLPPGKRPTVNRVMVSGNEWFWPLHPDHCQSCMERRREQESALEDTDGDVRGDVHVMTTEEKTDSNGNVIGLTYWLWCELCGKIFESDSRNQWLCPQCEQDVSDDAKSDASDDHFTAADVIAALEADRADDDTEPIFPAENLNLCPTCGFNSRNNDSAECETCASLREDAARDQPFSPQSEG